jgi:hypothetical protein
MQETLADLGLRSRPGGLSLAVGPIGNPPASSRIGVSRRQHTQQGRPTTRAPGSRAPLDPRDRPGPLKPLMHRCVFLGFRFIHRDKTPIRRNATQTTGPRFTIPLDQEEPKSPRHGLPGGRFRSLQTALATTGSTREKLSRLTHPRERTTQASNADTQLAPVQNRHEQVNISSDNSRKKFDCRHFWRSGHQNRN